MSQRKRGEGLFFFLAGGTVSCFQPGRGKRGRAPPLLGSDPAFRGGGRCAPEPLGTGC